MVIWAFGPALRVVPSDLSSRSAPRPLPIPAPVNRHRSRHRQPAHADNLPPVIDPPVILAPRRLLGIPNQIRAGARDALSYFPFGDAGGARKGGGAISRTLGGAFMRRPRPVQRQLLWAALIGRPSFMHSLNKKPNTQHGGHYHVPKSERKDGA